MTFLQDGNNKEKKIESVDNLGQKSSTTKRKPGYVEGEEAAQNFESLAKSVFSPKKGNSGY